SPTGSIEQSNQPFPRGPAARHNRRESPDERHEAGDDNGLRPVAGVEHPRSFDVAGVEQERLGPREEPRPQTNTDGITDAVAGDRGDDEHDVEPPDVEPARGRDDAGRDQERIAREEETDEQAGFSEDDHEENNVAAPADQVVE